MQSNSQKPEEIKKVVPDTKVVGDTAIPIEQDATTDKKPDMIGIVTDCMKLNVRKAPNTNAEVIAVISALTEVVIDTDESDDAFYKVHTSAGICGFCMKKFIAVHR